jgi:hypothetical protein
VPAAPADCVAGPVLATLAARNAASSCCFAEAWNGSAVGEDPETLLVLEMFMLSVSELARIP